MTPNCLILTMNCKNTSTWLVVLLDMVYRCDMTIPALFENFYLVQATPLIYFHIQPPNPNPQSFYFVNNASFIFYWIWF